MFRLICGLRTQTVTNQQRKYKKKKKYPAFTDLFVVTRGQKNNMTSSKNSKQWLQ